MNLLLDIKHALLPETIMCIVILAICVLTFLLDKSRQKYIYYASMFGVILAMISFIFLPLNHEYNAFWSSFTSNNFTILFRGLILLGTVLTLLLSKRYTSGYGSSIGEFYALLLTASLGALLLAGANDFIMVFVGLETLSISSFALCGYTKLDKLSNEAALKYLIIGAASSAVMLYGFSFLYGISGQTNLASVAQYLVSAKYTVNLVLILSFLLILGGLCYKLAAVPFHVWAPDVYQGAPIPVAAFLSVVSKIAGFAVLIRVITLIFGNIPLWSLIIAVIAVLTMTIGNLMAINQSNIKRLMAYSSIAQAGYILTGLAVFTDLGISSMIFYLITYLFMNFGTWAAIELFISRTGKDSIDDFGGLAYKQPLFAFGLTICLLSLAGIPITAGFFSKFYLFQAIALAGYKFIWLLIITLINTIIAVYYYLRIIKAMYVKPAVLSGDDLIVKSRSLNSVLGFTVATVLVIGILASPFIALSKATADAIKMPVTKSIFCEKCD